MNRLLLVVAAWAAVAVAAKAHMVYVVPTADGRGVTVVFSDDLEPDQKVKMDKVAGLKLVARTGEKDVPLDYARGDHSFAAKLPVPARVVHGSAVYGLLSKAEKPTLLVYHPKAVLAGAGTPAAVGEAAELEIVPVTTAGKTRFRLLAKGKAVADAEGGATLPDGTKAKLRTDADGYTGAFEQAGRCAAYLKRTEAKAGEHAGQKYEEIRRYATLVVDVAR